MAMVMVMVRVTTTLLVDMEEVMITPPDTEMDMITLDTTSRDTDKMDTETIVSRVMVVGKLPMPGVGGQLEGHPTKLHQIYTYKCNIAAFQCCTCSNVPRCYINL